MKDSTLDIRREEKNNGCFMFVASSHSQILVWFSLFPAGMWRAHCFTRFEHACVINSAVRRILESKFLRTFNISNQLSCFSLGEGSRSSSLVASLKCQRLEWGSDMVTLSHTSRIRHDKFDFHTVLTWSCPGLDCCLEGEKKHVYSQKVSIS